VRLDQLLEVNRQLSRIQPLESLLGAIAATCGRLLDSNSVGIRILDGGSRAVKVYRGRESDARSKGSSLAGERPAADTLRREARSSMSLEYRERSTLGSGWALEVRASGVLVGHIRLGAVNLFRYYEGAENELTPLLSDSDLEALRRKVEDHRRR